MDENATTPETEIEPADTTEGCTREDVDAAMAFLGIFNPKPNIPLETTVSGHEIVALARRLAETDAIVNAIIELGGFDIDELRNLAADYLVDLSGDDAEEGDDARR